MPADGTRAAALEKRRLRYVAAFVGQLSDKPLLASISRLSKSDSNIDVPLALPPQWGQKGSRPQGLALLEACRRLRIPSARGVNYIRAMKLKPDRAGTGVSGQR